MWYVRLLIFFHMVGACIWVGGHLILLFRYVPLALKKKDPLPVLGFEQKYEKMGILALALQVITGILLGTDYHIPWFSFENHMNTVFSIKLILMLVTVVLAVHARIFVIPRVSGKNLKLLVCHIAAVTLLSLAFVFMGVSFRMGW